MIVMCKIKWNSKLNNDMNHLKLQIFMIYSVAILINLRNKKIPRNKLLKTFQALN